MTRNIDPRVKKMIKTGAVNTRLAVERQQQHDSHPGWIEQILSRLAVNDTRWANEEGGWG